jgi:3-oxoacyl-[acyl-carrier-protein] synthase-3
MACTVADRLGQKGVGGYVLNTACGGFVSGLATAYAYIKAGIYEKVLVVASEALSRTVALSDPRTAIIFGDGAGAVLVGASNTGGMRSPAYTASEWSDHISLQNTGVSLPEEAILGPEAEYVSKECLNMPGGPRVLRRAIVLMEDAARKSLEMSEWELSDIDCLVPHQANSRITWGLADRMKVSKEKVLDTIAFHGNTSGASIPLAIDSAVRGLPEAGGVSISRGDRLLLTAVGGGYSIAAAVLEF